MPSMNVHHASKPWRIQPFIRPFIFLGGLVLLSGISSPALAQDDSPSIKIPSELRLSLQDAMKAAVDENPTVQLFKERITQAKDQAFTQLGTLLPNLSATASAARRRFFLGSFAGSPSVSSRRDFYQARVSFTQNIFSLSLIQKWRAARTNVEV